MCITSAMEFWYFFLFLKNILFIYSFMRNREREAETARGRSRLPAGNPMWDLIPGPCDHNLSQKQTINHWATQVSQDNFSMYLLYYLLSKEENRKEKSIENYE